MSKQGRGRDSIKGSWADAEDNELRYLVDDGRNANWSSIAERMGGRTAKQCRERWVQNLRPNLNHGPIVPQEGEFIMHQVDVIGKKWAEIARRLEASNISIRSDNAVKNWYNGTVNRQIRANRRREAAAAAHHHHQHRMHSSSSNSRSSSGRTSSSSSNTTTAVSPSPSSLSARSGAVPPGLSMVQQRDLPRPMTGASDLLSPTTSTTSHGEYEHHASASSASSSYGYSSASRYNYLPAGHSSTFHRRHSGHQLPPLHDAIAHSDRHHHQDREADNYWQQQQNHYPHQNQQQQRFGRRGSIYTLMDSPRSDSADHAYVPSLVSDTGSPPSIRESPTHAPASPNTNIPPILAPLAPIDEKDVHGLHGFHRSPPTMARSWSGHSDDQYRFQHQPLPDTLEPEPIAPRPSSSGRVTTSRPSLADLLNR